MASNTGITDFMNMTVLRFYDTWQALCAVCERRREEYERAKNK